MTSTCFRSCFSLPLSIFAAFVELAKASVPAGVLCASALRVFTESRNVVSANASADNCGLLVNVATEGVQASPID